MQDNIPLVIYRSGGERVVVGEARVMKDETGWKIVGKVTNSQDFPGYEKIVSGAFSIGPSFFNHEGDVVSYVVPDLREEEVRAQARRYGEQVRWLENQNPMPRDYYWVRRAFVTYRQQLVDTPLFNVAHEAYVGAAYPYDV